jgi:hypothetical protein
MNPINIIPLNAAKYAELVTFPILLKIRVIKIITRGARYEIYLFIKKNLLKEK